MTFKEAEQIANEMNTHKGYTAKVVRTLPEYDHPIVDGDDGWDVFTTVDWSK